MDYTEFKEKLEGGFTEKCSFEMLISKLEDYFGCGSEEPSESAENEASAVTMHISEVKIDLSEADILNEAMSPFYIREGKCCIDNEVSYKLFIKGLEGYDEIENVIERFDEDERAVLNCCIDDMHIRISEIREADRDSDDSSETKFKEIIDKFKNNVLKDIIAEKFIDRITEKFNDSAMYGELLEAVNGYIRTLGVYTVPLTGGSDDFEIILPANGADKHDIAAERILRLPYCINYSTDGRIIKRASVSGKLMCRFEDKNSNEKELL